MGIDLYQDDLDAKLDQLLITIDYDVTKTDIMHEVCSNHRMTQKDFDDLVEDGFVEIIRERNFIKLKVLIISEFTEIDLTTFIQKFHQNNY